MGSAFNDIVHVNMFLYKLSQKLRSLTGNKITLYFINDKRSVTSRLLRSEVTLSFAKAAGVGGYI